MAWMGDISRDLVAVRPDGAGSILVFSGCQHEQRSALPPNVAIRLRSEICAECSKPHWARVKQIQDSISFDDVLRRLRTLGWEKELLDDDSRGAKA